MPELREEQKQGVEWIERGFKEYHGVILADRMGLGKTAQAIEILKRRPGKCLIICPSYVALNWKDELLKWDVDRSVCIIDSSKQLLNDADIYIVSYDMSTKYPFIFKQLFKLKYDLMICDESHYLKSWNSLRSRRILGTLKNTKTHLKARTKNILCLTGTPILNRIEELYNVIIRIAPQALFYSTKDNFILTYAAHVYSTAWGLKHEGVKNDVELKKLISGVLLSRQEIKNLPDRIDRPIPISTKKPNVEKFIQQEKDFLIKYNIRPDEVYKLQKMDKVEGGQIAELRQRVAITKIPVFLTALKDVIESGNEQILLYCYHRRVQTALEGEIKKKFPGQVVEIINGMVSMKNRHEIIKRFQAGKTNIILATIGALKEGVNLYAASVVMFIEFDWTPAAIAQAIARVHRRGQKRTVQVFYFYYQSGIDRHIMRLLEKKSIVIKKLIGG